MKLGIYWIISMGLLFLFPLSTHASFLLIKHSSFGNHGLFSSLLGLMAAVLLIRYTDSLRWIYILFHEISHALLTLFIERKVYEMKVSKDYGYVKSDTNHLIVRLAPYLFPLVSYVLLGLFYIFAILDRARGTEELRERPGMMHGILFLIVLFTTSTTYYNFLLIKRETSDISQDQVYLSLLFIANSYLVTTSALFYLFFNYRSILNHLFVGI